jgi:hypothetical protein
MAESKKKSLQLQHQEMIEEEVSLVYPFFHEGMNIFQVFQTCRTIFQGCIDSQICLFQIFR